MFYSGDKTSLEVLQRLGGWDQVYKLPVEIISSYPDGEPIKYIERRGLSAGCCQQKGG